MSEHEEQTLLFNWAKLAEAHWPELALMFAVPSGGQRPSKIDRSGHRYSPVARKLKEEGVKAGVPDVWLPCPRGGYVGLIIELKYGRNYPTQEQKDWLNTLADQGHSCHVCYGFDTARQVIEWYLHLPRMSALATNPRLWLNRFNRLLPDANLNYLTWHDQDQVILAILESAQIA